MPGPGSSWFYAHEGSNGSLNLAAHRAPPGIESRGFVPYGLPKRSARQQGLPRSSLLSCFLFPLLVKQIQSGLGRAPKCRFALLRGLLFLASSKTGMQNPGHLRPPAALTPADAALTPADAGFLFEVGASSLGTAVGFFGGEGAWGCHPSCSPSSPRSLSVLPFPSLPPPLPSSLPPSLLPSELVGSYSSQSCWGEVHLLPEGITSILPPSWFWGPLKACVSVSPVPQSSLSCPGLGSACVQFALGPSLPLSLSFLESLTPRFGFGVLLGQSLSLLHQAPLPFLLPGLFTFSFLL